MFQPGSPRGGGLEITLTFCLQLRQGPRRLARPRTSPFHGGNAGSNPAGDAIIPKDFLVEAIERGWGRLLNGELIAAAEAAGFEVLLTTEKNIRYQQNLKGRKIDFVIISNQQWPTLRHYVERVVAAVNATFPGSYAEVDIPLSEPPSLTCAVEQPRAASTAVASYSTGMTNLSRAIAPFRSKRHGVSELPSRQRGSVAGAPPKAGRTAVARYRWQV